MTILSNNGDDVNFLKFLRGFYNLLKTSDDSEGPLGILLEKGSDIGEQITALGELYDIFGYGIRCEFIEIECERISQRTLSLRKSLELEENKQEALEKARAFCRQLNAEERALEGLDKRLPDEIKVYEAAGLDTSALESLVNTPGKIDQFKQDPTELIACINDTIIQQIGVSNFENKIKEIKALIDDIFKSKVLDEPIKETFLRFTRGYLKSFVELHHDLPTILKDEEDAPNSAKIYFRRTFSKEQFKQFVESSLGVEDIQIEPPSKGPVVDLVFKSTLAKPRGHLIQVKSEKYGIKTSFFATFFPHVPGSSNH